MNPTIRDTLEAAAYMAALIVAVTVCDLINHIGATQ